RYDDNSNRIRITHPDGHWFGALHDALNRQYYLFGEGEAPLVYSEYAAHGALAFTGRPASATWLGYDAVQRPASRRHDFNGGGGDVVWAYAYNPAGQIAALSRDNDAYAWTGHYATDRNYVANGLNQYSAAGGATFAYDANGNLTSDGSRAYSYDVENRLVASSAGAALAYD